MIRSDNTEPKKMMPYNIVHFKIKDTHLYSRTFSVVPEQFSPDSVPDNHSHRTTGPGTAEIALGHPHNSASLPAALINTEPNHSN